MLRFKLGSSCPLAKLLLIVKEKGISCEVGFNASGLSIKAVVGVNSIMDGFVSASSFEHYQCDSRIQAVGVDKFDLSGVLEEVRNDANITISADDSLLTFNVDGVTIGIKKEPSIEGIQIEHFNIRGDWAGSVAMPAPRFAEICDTLLFDNEALPVAITAEQAGVRFTCAETDGDVFEPVREDQTVETRLFSMVDSVVSAPLMLGAIGTFNNGIPLAEFTRVDIYLRSGEGKTGVFIYRLGNHSHIKLWVDPYVPV